MDPSKPEIKPDNSKQQESSFWGWGGFIESITSQATNIVNMYKEDLKEFGSTITSDTSEALNVAATKASELISETDGDTNAPQQPNDPNVHESSNMSNLRSGLSHIIDGISDFTREFTQYDADNSATSIARSPSSSSLIYSSKSPSVSNVPSIDVNSTDIANQAEEEEFQKFLETFDMKSKQHESTMILANNPSVFSLHQQLVPNELSPMEFWGRYYFKLEKAAKKEAQRTNILTKAIQFASLQHEDDFSWDDEESTETGTAEARNQISQISDDHLAESPSPSIQSSALSIKGSDFDYDALSASSPLQSKAHGFTSDSHSSSSTNSSQATLMSTQSLPINTNIDRHTNAYHHHHVKQLQIQNDAAMSETQSNFSSSEMTEPAITTTNTFPTDDQASFASSSPRTATSLAVSPGSPSVTTHSSAPPPRDSEDLQQSKWAEFEAPQPFRLVHTPLADSMTEAPFPETPQHGNANTTTTKETTTSASQDKEEELPTEMLEKGKTHPKETVEDDSVFDWE